MKNYINSDFFVLENKILNKVRDIKSDLSARMLINHIIYLNLKTEKLLFEKNTCPEIDILGEIEYLYTFIKHLASFSDFSEKEIQNQDFVLEENHETLFQKLWINFTFEEYKEERIGRYSKRIKINHIESLIENKKIVDFGCGHGNFLMSMQEFNPNECVGIDYGEQSIHFASQCKNKFFPEKNISFLVRSVYQSGLQDDYFDFAIQNGVFHHLENEEKAYSEVYRVLKQGGYFWVYTDGGGGIRDYIGDLSQKLLKNIDNNIVQDQIRTVGLTTNKEYHLGDSLSARYRHTDLPSIKAKLEGIGFEYVKQLNGGCETDFDRPFCEDRFFEKKFGSGDLRLLFRKVECS